MKSYTTATGAQRRSLVAATALVAGLLVVALLVGGAACAYAASLNMAELSRAPATDAAAPDRAATDIGTSQRWMTDTIHPIEYRGTIEMLPEGALSGAWQVGGHQVSVSAGTDLKLQLGAIQPNAYVQIIGRLQRDGAVAAAKVLVKKAQPGQGIDHSRAPTSTVTLIKPEPASAGDDQDDSGDDTETGDVRPWDVRVHGPVTGITKGMTDTLVIDGKTVLVDAATWVKAQGALAEGSWVQVKGILMPDGTIRATSMQWVHRVPAKANQTNGPAARLAPAGRQAAPDVPNTSKGKGSGTAVSPGQGQSLGPGAGQGQGKSDHGQDRGGNGQGQGSTNGKGHK